MVLPETIDAVFPRNTGRCFCVFANRQYGNPRGSLLVRDVPQVQFGAFELVKDLGLIVTRNTDAFRQSLNHRANSSVQHRMCGWPTPKLVI